MKNMNTNTIQPAERVQNVEEYYFSIKLKEIAQLKAAGADIINLGIGSPDLPPSRQIVDVLCKNANQENAHGYQSYIGIPELRNAFAKWYHKYYGVDLNPNNQILPLMGSKEGIMHISMAFLNPGDSVLIPNPGYPTYAAVTKLVGAKSITYSLRADNNWEPDFEALEEADAKGELSLKNTKIMWCNYPNMPTGANASTELFEKIIKFGKKHNIVICHDNPYSFILTEHPLSILSVPGAEEICIELNSLSKASNMPGWRIGMVASNPLFIEWILKVKSNMDSGMFKPMQLAAARALEAPNEWYINMNREYKKRRILATQILKAIGAEVREDQVGLFLWGKVKKDGKSIVDELLYDKHIFLTPGFIFGSEGKQYIRISLCANEDTLQRALRRLTLQTAVA